MVTLAPNPATDQLNDLIVKIDASDMSVFKDLTRDIVKLQPSFSFLMLNHFFSLDPKVLYELTKVYYLVWVYFRKSEKLPSKVLKKEDFFWFIEKNEGMIKYMKKEGQEGANLIHESIIKRIKSISLLKAVLLQFTSNTVFLSHDPTKIEQLFLELLSVIECLDAGGRPSEIPGV